MDAELRLDLCPMPVDGANTQDKLVRDLSVGVALGQERKDLRLASGEYLVVSGGLSRLDTLGELTVLNPEREWLCDILDERRVLDFEDAVGLAPDDAEKPEVAAGGQERRTDETRGIDRFEKRLEYGRRGIKLCPRGPLDPEGLACLEHLGREWRNLEGLAENALERRVRLFVVVAESEAMHPTPVGRDERHQARGAQSTRQEEGRVIDGTLIVVGLTEDTRQFVEGRSAFGSVCPRSGRDSILAHREHVERAAAVTVITGSPAADT